MISTKKGIAIILSLAIMVATASVFLSYHVDGTVKDQMTPRLTAFKVDRGMFLASIYSASMLEVWEIASSTEDAEKKIGDMQSMDNEWKLPVPRDPHLVYTYEVRAYDDVGREIDSRRLDIEGQNEMYTLIWGPTGIHTKEVKVNEEFRYNDLEFKITEIKSDNRCPQNKQCVHSGYVVFDYEAKTDRTAIKESGQSDEDILFDRYIIRVQEVDPLQEESIKEIEPSEYRFTVNILINTEALPLDTIDQHDEN